MSRAATQTIAIFHDAYRELNAKRLFWIVMIISVVIVAAFALVGLTDKGLKVIVWEIPIPFFNRSTMEPAMFYKMIFVNLGIGFWLSWGATILAIISTASIIPEFVSSGSIELTLSRPVSRLRLFLTKYLTGLLFVALQVTVFTLAAFVVIGFKGDAWMPKLFWAIPIVVLFFSYLFSICALVGLLTRSTIAALLITLLMWLFFFGLNATDGIFVSLRETTRLRENVLAKRVERLERNASLRIWEKRRAEAGEPAPPEGTPPPVYTPAEIDAENPLIQNQRTKLAAERASLAKWTRWASIFYWVKTPLPKTSETLALLERTLISEEELERLRTPNDDQPVAFGEQDDVQVSAREAQLGSEKALRARSTAWIIGTSLGFEAFILGIACVIFCRRDF
ncbi:MAG: ABC transporter permease [Planctomycetota bacterium]|nr:ABC transporter permease [Planctomycetota bacterium]